jgi:hypothetical protein
MSTIAVNLIKPELDRLPTQRLYMAEQAWGNLKGTHGNFSYDNDNPGYVHQHVASCLYMAGAKKLVFLPNVYGIPDKAAPTELYLPLLDAECKAQGAQWCVQVDKGMVNHASDPTATLQAQINRYSQLYFGSQAYLKDSGGKPAIFEFGVKKLIPNWDGFCSINNKFTFICQQNGTHSAPACYAWINPFDGNWTPQKYLQSFVANPATNIIPAVWRAFNDGNPANEARSVWNVDQPARVHKSIDPATGKTLLSELVDVLVATKRTFEGVIYATSNDKQEGSASETFFNLEYDLSRWPNLQL